MTTNTTAIPALVQPSPTGKTHRVVGTYDLAGRRARGEWTHPNFDGHDLAVETACGSLYSLTEGVDAVGRKGMCASCARGLR
jgi:hypothetical protein